MNIDSVDTDSLRILQAELEQYEDHLQCSHCGSTRKKPNIPRNTCKFCDGKGSENPYVDEEGRPYHDYPEK